jgi:hypothetical protein
MRWSDLEGNVWTIATEPRDKTNGGVLVLPEMVMAIINAQPRVDGNPFVFPGQRRVHFSAFSIYKVRLDHICVPTCRTGRFTICAGRRGRFCRARQQASPQMSPNACSGTRFAGEALKPPTIATIIPRRRRR